MNTKDFLAAIAAVIRLYEDPTGRDCSNNVGARITVNEKEYVFNGEAFEEIK